MARLVAPAFLLAVPVSFVAVVPYAAGIAAAPPQLSLPPPPSPASAVRTEVRIHPAHVPATFRGPE
jgi:hypothetical protein